MGMFILKIFNLYGPTSSTARYYKIENPSLLSRIFYYSLKAPSGRELSPQVTEGERVEFKYFGT